MSELLTFQQLTSEGESAYQRGDYLAAAHAFQAAAQGLSSAGEPLAAAEIANNASVALLKARDAQGALQALDGTEQVFAAKGDIKRQGMAVGNRAAALDELGEREAALAAYQEAADLLKQAGEFELRAYVMQAISALQLHQGDYLQAFVTMYAGVNAIPRPNTAQKVLKTILEAPFRFLRGP